MLGTMWTLYQFPLCPFSRKVRLLLGEKGVPYAPVRESPWLRRDEFLDLNPAGQTPVMAYSERGGMPLIDSGPICEYFEETVDKAAMINGTAADRAEIRRLTIWFDTAFYRDVTGPLLFERMEKRLVHRAAPDSGALREAMKAAIAHLDYIDYLLDHRAWLAGATMSLADLAAAAHISVADYLGGIDWKGHEQAKRWYVGMKSRPSMRPLLAERMEVISPPADYENLDL
jgi:glutathione S-transferase